MATYRLWSFDYRCRRLLDLALHWFDRCHRSRRGNWWRKRNGLPHRANTGLHNERGWGRWRAHRFRQSGDRRQHLVNHQARSLQRRCCLQGHPQQADVNEYHGGKRGQRQALATQFGFRLGSDHCCVVGTNRIRNTVTSIPNQPRKKAPSVSAKCLISLPYLVGSTSFELVTPAV